MQYRRKNGSVGWFDLSGEMISTGSTESIWSFLDITDKKNAALQQERLVAEQKALLNNDLVGIVTVQDRNIVWANPAFEKLFGYGPGEILGRPVRVGYCSDEAYEAFGKSAYPVISSGQAYRTEYEYQRKDGSRFFADVSGSLLSPTTGETLWCFIDVTERKRNEKEIRQLAFYDPLTALPNRRLMLDRLSQTLSANKRGGRHGAVMYVDLDNFKPLNDIHGHGVGDLLLLEVAQRIKACVRQIDTVSRFGGDEFVVLLGDLAKDKVESKLLAKAIAEKIRARLAEVYVLTVAHQGQASTTVEHRCTASIGVLVFGSESTNSGEILQLADAAMYAAKDVGRNTVRFSE
jgi:diguanylate cyclase (GGDEF)-like protein/PAS domain S-box-containing protein